MWRYNSNNMERISNILCIVDILSVLYYYVYTKKKILKNGIALKMNKLQFFQIYFYL